MWGDFIHPHPLSLFLQIIPAELRNKWQQYAEDLDSPLGGTSDRPISSIVITLEVPDAIVVVSTAGQSMLYNTNIIAPLPAIHVYYMLFLRDF